jgi:hypothetical protein
MDDCHLGYIYKIPLKKKKNPLLEAKQWKNHESFLEMMLFLGVIFVSVVRIYKVQPGYMVRL